MLKTIVSILILVSLMSCATSNPKDRYVKGMRWLHDADPEEDIQKAFANLDFRFKGMNNHGKVVVPLFGGKEKLDCKNWKTDVDVIGGTDYFPTYKTKKLDMIGYLYAEYYNGAVWHYWTKKYIEHIYAINKSYEQLDVDTIDVEVGKWRQCTYLRPALWLR